MREEDRAAGVAIMAPCGMHTRVKAIYAPSEGKTQGRVGLIYFKDGEKKLMIGTVYCRTNKENEEEGFYISVKQSNLSALAGRASAETLWVCSHPQDI